MPGANPDRYAYEVDLGGNDTAARVVRMVGKGRRVLELGAGPGSITRHLQQRGRCDVTALEYDQDSITRLGAFCDKVFRCDLNDPSWTDLLPAADGFDVIVAADVLEHLYDPWRTLALMKGLLGNAGHVVVSLPHVGHHAVTAGLLQERFEYGDSGLLDRTHIRFFGIHDMQALFERAGFGIVEAEFVERAPEQTEFADRWQRLPKAIRDMLAINPFGTVYQVVVKAAPRERVGKGITLASLPLGEFSRPTVDRPEPPLCREPQPLDALANLLELQGQVVALHSDLERRDDELEHLRVIIDRQDEYVRSLLNSTSWKFSAPIRLLGRLKDRLNRNRQSLC